MYNLIARGIEQELIPMAKELGVSIIVYNPLAARPPDRQTQLRERSLPERASTTTRSTRTAIGIPQDFAAVEKLRKIAADAGRSLISLSLNWLLHHTATDCIILGASRLEQLDAEHSSKRGRPTAGRGR